MKKIVRHFMALFLSLVMILAMGLTAFADPTTDTNTSATTYKLTLTGTATGHTYEAYQIFTGDLSTNAEGKKVLSNVAWGKGVTYTGTESAPDVAKALGDGSMTIEQLEEKLTLTTAAKSVASAEDNTVIDGLAAGYYLVKDKEKSQNGKSDAYTQFVVQVVGDTEAAIKSDVPTVEKKVQDKNDSTGATSEWQDSADYDINDWVPYQITGTMPDNIADYTSYKYVFTDTMSAGLTYDKEDADHKAKITIGNTDVTSSFTEAVTTGENGSTVVTWTCNDLKKINGVTLDASTTVVVNYSAKLNVNAALGSAGNPNTVNLTYSNNPNNGGEGETGKTPDDKNIVFTYKTIVNKVDQDKQSLAGAGFKLEKKNSDGTYTTVKEFTAGTETSFEFDGLDDGDYKLIESTTPAGYNTITPVEFTISAEHEADSTDPKLTSLSGNATTGEATFTANTTEGSLTTDIVNKKGSLLPSTGGRGTTLLYLGGAVLAIAAGTILVLKKKMNRG